MKKEIVTVNTYHYLPYSGIWGLALLGGAAGLVVSGRIVLGLVAVALSVMVMTAHYGIRVNTRDKTFQDFLSLFWMISGEVKSYDVIDYVFIKTSKMSQTMNSLITTRSFTDDYYDGYIKFDGNEKVYLLTHKKKERVLKTLQELSDQLGLEIVDHSENTN